MITRNEYDIKCDYCGSVYTQVSHSDDGVDWMGHRRAAASFGKEFEKCPICEHDIKKAYAIILEREEKEENERVAIAIALSEIKYKYVVSVVYNAFQKQYDYVSEQELEPESLVLISNTSGFQICNVVKCKKIDEKLDLEELNRIYHKLKPLKVSKFDDLKLIIESYIQKHSDEDYFKSLGNLSDIGYLAGCISQKIATKKANDILRELTTQSSLS